MKDSNDPTEVPSSTSCRQDWPSAVVALDASRREQGMHSAMHQIGEAAGRVGLSLRTVRYYEEVGLVVPSGHTPGGFRLYTDEDIERLELIKRMKPLGFDLEAMCELLSIRDRLANNDPDAATLADRLATYAHAAAGRCERLREQLAFAEEFAAALQEQVEKYATPVEPQ